MKKNIFVFITVLLSTLENVSAADHSVRIKTIRQTLSQLVEGKTFDSEAAAIKIGAERLKKAGIHYEITEFAPGRQNLVARLKGNGLSKPLLILAHVDVVPAWGQKWTTEPHKVTEVDGFLLGRGVADNLGYAAVALELFIQLKESGTVFSRDIILAWTGAEEIGGGGVKYLLKNHPEQVQAEIILNEGGGVTLDEVTKKPKYISVEASQKILQDFELVSKGDSGHSSRPYGRNAIFEMAKAVAKIEKYQFPAKLNSVTRAYFKARAELEDKKNKDTMLKIVASKNSVSSSTLRLIADKPEQLAMLRTTCVPTMINGGISHNALPTETKTLINCRILPDETIEDTHKKIIELVQNPNITVKLLNGRGPSKPSSVDGPFMKALKIANTKTLNNLPIIPAQHSGATDSCFFRNLGMQAYGIGPIFRYESDGKRSHGVDERIPIAGLEDGYEFFYQLVTELANQK